MPKRDLERERSFVVFEVYYKYGQYEVKYHHSVANLENYLDEQLQDYCEDEGCDYEEVLKEIADDVEETRLQKLIAIVIEKGQKRVKEQAGFGVVAVEELASE